MESHISITDAKNKLSDIVTHVAYVKESVIITKRGKEMVAIIPIEQANKKAAQKRLQSIEEFATADAIDSDVNPTDFLRTMREDEMKTLVRQNEK